MKLYKATEPLEFVGIDILGDFIRTKSGNRFLVIIDRFTKLKITVTIKRAMDIDAVHEFVHSWVFKYVVPRAIMSDNGIPFMALFFTEFCRSFVTRKVSTRTYPQFNGKVERYKRKILSSLS